MHSALGGAACPQHREFFTRAMCSSRSDWTILAPMKPRSQQWKELTSVDLVRCRNSSILKSWGALPRLLLLLLGGAYTCCCCCCYCLYGSPQSALMTTRSHSTTSAAATSRPLSHRGCWAACTRMEPLQGAEMWYRAVQSYTTNPFTADTTDYTKTLGASVSDHLLYTCWR